MEYTYLKLDFLNQFFNQSGEKVHQLLDMFTASTKSDVEALYLSFQLKNHKQLAIHAHRLKSAFRYLGMMEVANICEHLENSAIDKSSWEHIKKGIDACNHHYTIVMEEINHYIEHAY